MFRHLGMDVWQGVAIVSLKFGQGPSCPTLLRAVGRLPMKRPYSHVRGGPATVFYSLGYPTPYAYVSWEISFHHLFTRQFPFL
jgi:hypothetical protein